MKVDVPLDFDANLDASVGYDFKKQSNDIENLSEVEKSAAFPWSPIEMNLGVRGYGYSSSTLLTYDLANQAYRTLQQNLSTPSIFSINPLFTYKIHQNFIRPTDGGAIQIERTRTAEAKVTWKWRERFKLLLYYGAREFGKQTQEKQFAKSVVLQYFAGSKCWGLDASWHKEFASSDQNGVYLLSFTLDFFGVRRNLGNIAEKFNRADP